MTEQTFYRGSLLVPVVCTIGAWAVVYAEKTAGDGSRVPESLVTTALFLGYGGLWGAIPYSIVAVLVFWFLRRPNGTRVSNTRILALAPIGVTIVAYLLMIVVAIVKRDMSVLGAAYFFALWAIIIGYGYVIVIWIGFKIAQQLKWITLPDPS